MKKIYITDARHAKTLDFLHCQAEEALRRDHEKGARAALMVNAYIARHFSEVRRMDSFGLWKDAKGLHIVCFETKAEHATFVAELLAKGKDVAMSFGKEEALDAVSEQGD